MSEPSVQIERFGETPDGEPVEAVTLDGGDGLVVTVLSYGATLQRIVLADGTDVLLGFDDLAEYRRQRFYFGATVGRYANRIGGGKVEINGVAHELSRNNGANTLHGGEVGLDRALWRIEQAGPADEGGAELVMSHVSPDGDQGFPGELAVIVRFHVSGSRLAMRYLATTTATTPVSLTSHGYFNLAGEGAGDILDHELAVCASQFLPIDPWSIPAGAPAPVENTPFDFMSPRRIGDGIDAEHQQIDFGAGYDHCFVLDELEADKGLAAELRDPASGRVMRVYTTEPGLQVYTGNALDGALSGKSGRPYRRNAGICLETQAFPDSPNRPDFPNTLLAPGEVYESQTVLEFDHDA